jgi:uncharacterized membrane protein
MFAIPTVPSWNALHPIAVHLPIGVLAAAPVLLLLSLFFGRRNKGIAGATLILLLIGAAGCLLAASTGEAAAESAIIRGAEADAVLEEHEELAEVARNIFLGLAGLYLLILLVAAGLKDRLKPAGWVAIHIIYLVLYGAGLLVLTNAGHLGGRLVHQYGVRADITGPAPAARPAPAMSDAPAAPARKHDDD